MWTSHSIFIFNSILLKNDESYIEKSPDIVKI